MGVLTFLHGLDWYDYGARHYDAALGRWHILDPSSEKYYSVNPYAYCNNSPVKNLDLDGRDWYIYNETGELYFNRQLNHSEANFNDRLYTRIGGNNMMGDMKGIIEKAYSFEESSSIAMINGYSINPVQQTRSEVSREQIYQTGKHTTAIITGKVEIVNERYGIFSVDDKIKDCFKTESLFDKGQTALGFFDKAVLKGQNTDIVKRDFFSYSQPVLSKKIGNILSSIVGVTEVMGGKHDYRNVTVYNSWNIYSSVTNGKGRMLKYK